MRNLDGRAETGVSIFMLVLLFWLGGGRAKGFGGPCAPAESSVGAEGEGGGRTTPVCALDGRDVASVVAVPRGELDSAVALPPSDGSSGICTFSRGREAPPPTRRLFDREGGVNVVSGIDDIELLRFAWACIWVFVLWGTGGEAVGREVLLPSIDCERFPLSVFTSGLNAAKC